MTAISKPWNKHRTIGQKRPLKISHIWGSRIRLEIEDNKRDLALFNLALGSKLRGCDLVKLLVPDVMSGGVVMRRALVTQQKLALRFSSKLLRVPESLCWTGAILGA